MNGASSIPPLQTRNLIWMNGQIVPEQEAKISVFDHGLLYGDGVFEGIRLYQKHAFMLDHHLLRLQNSADAIGLELPYNHNQWREQIEEMVNEWPHSTGYLRLVVTRGAGSLGIDPRRCQSPSSFMILSEFKMMAEEKLRNGINLIVAQTRRTQIEALDPRIKSLNYLNQIMAKIEANKAGADEALMLNHAGRIAEANAENIFLVTQNTLITPPPEEGALNGITKNVVIHLAKQNSITVEERPVDIEEIKTANECFLTGTGAELIPVKNINNHHFASCPGEFYRCLQAAFHTFIQQPKLWTLF